MDGLASCQHQYIIRKIPHNTTKNSFYTDTKCIWYAHVLSYSYQTTCFEIAVCLIYSGSQYLYANISVKESPAASYEVWFSWEMPCTCDVILRITYNRPKRHPFDIYTDSRWNHLSLDQTRSSDYWDSHFFVSFTRSNIIALHLINIVLSLLYLHRRLAYTST